MPNKTRTDAARRERRKAKQSEFKREPKGTKMGHGPSGPATGHIDIASTIEKESNYQRVRRSSQGAFTTLGELLWSKGIEKL